LNTVLWTAPKLPWKNFPIVAFWGTKNRSRKGSLWNKNSFDFSRKI